MANSQNLRGYMHVKAVLDAAIEAGGGRYVLETYNAAVRWRFDAYQFRKLFVKNRIKELGVERVTTPYDHMQLRIEQTTVVIESKKVKGFLTTQDGTRIQIKDPVAVEDENLDVTADALKRELGL